MEVLRPATLDDAVGLRAERPEAVPIQGGTDVMVALNLGRLRPPALIDLSRIAALRGWSRSNGAVRLASGVTYSELLETPLREALPGLAAAARTIGSVQIRNRGTLGGGLAEASPASDGIPPLLVAGAVVELASVRGSRRVPVAEVVAEPGGSALAPDELVVAVHVRPSGARQTFMKVGGRNAMARAVVSLAVGADRERDELRIAFSSGAAIDRIEGSPADAAAMPQRVAAMCRPIDDVRASAAYRRHALRVLAARALDRCLS